MTFPRRILAYVFIDVLAINLIVFWWHQHLRLRVVVSASLLEIGGRGRDGVLGAEIRP